jgi:hypothetical protein
MSDDDFDPDDLGLEERADYELALRYADELARDLVQRHVFERDDYLNLRNGHSNMAKLGILYAACKRICTVGERVVDLAEAGEAEEIVKETTEKWKKNKKVMN